MRKPSAAHPLSVHVFGAVELQGAANGDELLSQPKRLGVFLYLLLARPLGFQRRERLVGLFWPELSETQARGALRKALHVMRKSLGEEAVLSRGDEEVSLAFDRIWCDALAFEEARRAERYAEMLELHSGDLLAGYFADAPGFERWLEEERSRVREQAGLAAWALAERYEKGSDLTSAARWARYAARYSGSDERRIRKVMQLLDRAGDRAGAIAVYEAFTKELHDELEVEPSPETQAVAKGIRGRS